MPVPKVKRVTLSPPNRPWRRPQCEGRVAEPTARWREHTGRDDRCKFKAWYEDDGVKLCKIHAGRNVLEKLCKEKKR